MVEDAQNILNSVQFSVPMRKSKNEILRIQKKQTNTA